MSEYWSGRERLLEGVECLATSRGEVPWSILAREASKGNGDSGVVPNEASIEVSKPEEGLNILNLPGFRPIQDSLDFGFVHGKPAQGHDITKVLDCILMPIALVGTCV